MTVLPDPPTLAFFEKEARETPKKVFAEPLKSLKVRKNVPKKQGKSEKEKSKEIEKKQGFEGQGRGASVAISRSALRFQIAILLRFGFAANATL